MIKLAKGLYDLGLMDIRPDSVLSTDHMHSRRFGIEPLENALPKWAPANRLYSVHIERHHDQGNWHQDCGGGRNGQSMGI